MNLMSFARWKCDAKSGAFGWCAVDVDGAVMLIHSPFHYAQSEACAVGAVGSRRVGAIEPFEDVRQRIGSNSDPVVDNFDCRMFSITGDRHTNVATPTAELDRIVDEIQDDP